MSKVLPLLSIVAGFLALVGALVLVPNSPAPLVLALFALVAAGFLIARRDRAGLATGIVAVLFTVAGLLGGASGVYFGAGEEGEESRGGAVGITPLMGQALLIIAVLTPAAALLWVWGGMTPQWLRLACAGALVLAALLALALHPQLVDQASAAGYLVGILALVGAALPGILALRGPPPQKPPAPASP